MKKDWVIFSILTIFTICTATTIYDIQYTTDPGPDNTWPSPLVGQTVTVEGVVLAAGFAGYQDNFYMSMLEGGAWKGIYVYFSQNFDLLPGDLVQVTGQVSEYYGFTELTWVSEVIILSSGNPLPDPVPVTCAELAPTGVGEPYESCLIELNDVTVVEEQINYGQWYVTDGTGIAQIDDGFFYLDDIDPPIVITLGMQWGKIIGCLDYSYDEYGLNPRVPEDLVPPTAVDDDFVSLLPLLLGNYPNPFNPATGIEFYLPVPAQTELVIYDVRGRKIRTLLQEEKPAGRHVMRWDGRNDSGQVMATGIYYYAISTENSSYTAVKKMMMIK